MLVPQVRARSCAPTWDLSESSSHKKDRRDEFFRHCVPLSVFCGTGWRVPETPVLLSAFDQNSLRRLNLVVVSTI